MRILSISIDKKLFDPLSSTAKRHVQYAGLFEEMHIIVLNRRSTLQEPQKLTEGILLHPTNSASKIAYLFDAFKIAKKLVNEGGEWVITAQDPFEIGLIGYFLKKVLHAPLNLQVHIDFHNPLFYQESLMHKLRVVLANFLLPRADSIRAVSQKIKGHLIDKLGINENKITLLPVYSDYSRFITTAPSFSVKEKYPNYDFVILMISRLVKQKNIGLAISAMKEFVKKHPNSLLLIVGSGPEEKYLKEKSVPISGNVIFESWTNDVLSYIKTSDVLLLTSNYEGWGMTAAEAMAAGTPVIMTDVGCANELLLDQQSGLVIPQGDKERCLAALETLYSKPDLRRQLAKAAQQTIAQWSLAKLENYRLLYQQSLEKATMSKNN